MKRNEARGSGLAGTDHPIRGRGPHARQRTMGSAGGGLLLQLWVAVAVCVLIVFVSSGVLISNKYRLMLAEDFKKDVGLLLSTLAASAESQFRLGEDGLISAIDIPPLRKSLPEALWTTITGPDCFLPEANERNKMWASDDPRIIQAIKAGSFKGIGREEIRDELEVSIVPELRKKIDQEGRAELSPLIEEYQSLRKQRAALNTKDVSYRERVAVLNEKIIRTFREIDGQAKARYSKPGFLGTFDTRGRLSPAYLSYKPIIYYNPSKSTAEGTFYQGAVRVEVATDAFSKQVETSVRDLWLTLAAVSIGACIIGFLAVAICVWRYRSGFSVKKSTHLTSR
jgi:hypothetical protein